MFSIFICVLLISAVPILAQEEEKSFSITMYPLGLVLGYYSGELEFKLSPNISIPLEIKYLSLTIGEQWHYGAFAGGPGFRYYPAGEGMQGVFVGPYLNYLNTSIEYTYTDIWTGEEKKVTGSASGVSLTAWFGYKIISGPIVIEFSTGVSLTMMSDLQAEYEDSKGVKYTVDYTGTGGAGAGWAGLGLGIGFAF